MKQQFRIRNDYEWAYPVLLLEEQGFTWKDSGLSPKKVPFQNLIKDHQQVIIILDHENKTIDRAYNFDAFEGGIVSRKKAVKSLKGGYQNEIIKLNGGTNDDGGTES